MLSRAMLTSVVIAKRLKEEDSEYLIGAARSLPNELMMMDQILHRTGRARSRPQKRGGGLQRQEVSFWAGLLGWHGKQAVQSEQETHGNTGLCYANQPCGDREWCLDLQADVLARGE